MGMRIMEEYACRRSKQQMVLKLRFNIKYHIMFVVYVCQHMFVCLGATIVGVTKWRLVKTFIFFSRCLSMAPQTQNKRGGRKDIALRQGAVYPFHLFPVELQLGERGTYFVPWTIPLFDAQLKFNVDACQRKMVDPWHTCVHAR